MPITSNNISSLCAAQKTEEKYAFGKPSGNKYVFGVPNVMVAASLHKPDQFKSASKEKTEPSQNASNHIVEKAETEELATFHTPI